MRFGDVLVSSAFLTPVTSPVLQIATFINYNISFVLTFILVVKLWRKPRGKSGMDNPESQATFGTRLGTNTNKRLNT